MKIVIVVETDPRSAEAENELFNTLQDAAFQEDIETIIEGFIEEIMDWRDIGVSARITEIK